MNYDFYGDKIGIYINIDGEKRYITEEEKDLLINGCLYENGQIIETQAYIDFIKNKETNLIEQEFTNSMKTITANYSNEEREGWNSQLEGAKLVLSGETSPLLEAIVAETGEDINVLAQSIVDKANLYEVEYAKALGIKRAKLSAL